MAAANGGDPILAHCLADIPMKELMKLVLPFRQAAYLEDFSEKLLGEGIAAPSDLLIVSKEALETKLSTLASFNFIEMADTISLRQAMVPSKAEIRKFAEGGRKRSLDRRARSRSPHRRRGMHGNMRGGHGHRNNSRPHRGNKGGGKNQHRNNSPRGEKEKPELWAAIENKDVGAVNTLLAQGKDPEERFEGWTPLMKASEEGAVEVMRMLLAKNVDYEASNKKGRTALSFAAAPSYNSKQETEFHAQLVRIIIWGGRGSRVVW